MLRLSALRSFFGLGSSWVARGSPPLSRRLFFGGGWCLCESLPWRGLGYYGCGGVLIRSSGLRFSLLDLPYVIDRDGLRGIGRLRHGVEVLGCVGRSGINNLHCASLLRPLCSQFALLLRGREQVIKCIATATTTATAACCDFFLSIIKNQHMCEKWWRGAIEERDLPQEASLSALQDCLHRF